MSIPYITLMFFIERLLIFRPPVLRALCAITRKTCLFRRVRHLSPEPPLAADEAGAATCHACCRPHFIFARRLYHRPLCLSLAAARRFIFHAAMPLLPLSLPRLPSGFDAYARPPVFDVSPRCSSP